MNLKLRNLGLPPKIFVGQSLQFRSPTFCVLVRSDVASVWDVSEAGLKLWPAPGADFPPMALQLQAKRQSNFSTIRASDKHMAYGTAA
jgi:hypothetical protein